MSFSDEVFGGSLHSVMLSVPDHPEEALNWCGPPVGQNYRRLSIWWLLLFTGRCVALYSEL